MKINNTHKGTTMDIILYILLMVLYIHVAALMNFAMWHYGRFLWSKITGHQYY